MSCKCNTNSLALCSFSDRPVLYMNIKGSNQPRKHFSLCHVTSTLLLFINTNFNTYLWEMYNIAFFCLVDDNILIKMCKKYEIYLSDLTAIFFIKRNIKKKKKKKKVLTLIEWEFTCSLNISLIYIDTPPAIGEVAECLIFKKEYTIWLLLVDLKTISRIYRNYKSKIYCIYKCFSGWFNTSISDINGLVRKKTMQYICFWLIWTRTESQI